MVCLLGFLFGAALFFLGWYGLELWRPAENIEKGSYPSLPLYGLLKCIAIRPFRFLACRPLMPYLRLVGGRLLMAGWNVDISPETFLMYQFSLSLIFLSAAILFGASLACCLLALLAGLFWPLLRLKNTVQNRKREIDTMLPQMLDALTLSVEAGLDFMPALDRLVSKWRLSLLTREFQRMLISVKTGMLRVDALTQLKDRLPFNSIQSLVSTLIQADRFGVSIGPVLRGQADRLRFERFENAERWGRAASQKLLFPLIICIMPAVFVVVLGPIIAKWISGGLSWMF